MCVVVVYGRAVKVSGGQRLTALSASPFLPSHPHDRDISFIVSIRVISCPQLIIQLSSHTVSDLVELVECKHRISLGSATIRQYAQDQTYQV